MNSLKLNTANGLVQLNCTTTKKVVETITADKWVLSQFIGMKVYSIKLATAVNSSGIVIRY